MNKNGIRLEPFSLDDVPRLLDWIGSEKEHFTWTGPGFGYPLSKERMEHHVRFSWRNPPVMRMFKGVEERTGEMEGYGEIASINYLVPSATLARIIVRPGSSRGRGLGKSLIEGLLRVSFDEMKLHRVDLRVFDFNEPAVRCYEKAGFKKEGLMRHSCRYGNEYWNAWVMSILQPEWRESLG